MFSAELGIAAGIGKYTQTCFLADLVCIGSVEGVVLDFVKHMIFTHRLGPDSVLAAVL